MSIYSMGGNRKFAAPAKAYRHTHESSHSEHRLNAQPRCTNPHRQQCAENEVCKVQRNGPNPPPGGAVCATPKKFRR